MEKEINRQKTKRHIFKGLKFTVAALLSIVLAKELGFLYAPTAGIITILSIQNTKRSTLNTAAKRSIAFAAAVFLAWLCFEGLGYTVFSFGIYLFFFSTLCFVCGWVEAVAMVSVLITHFLTEGNMHWQILINEAGLFVIGTGTGIIFNSALRRKEKEFYILAELTDAEIKEVLKRMSQWLLIEDKSGYNDQCFAELEKKADRAKKKAYENWENTLFSSDYGEIDYIEMRERQIIVLKHMYNSIKMLKGMPAQTEKVAQIINIVQMDYHKENPVDSLIYELEQVFADMKKERLPQSREEFEDRAVLYYIMKQLDELLRYKQQFMKRNQNLKGIRKE